MGPGTQPEGFKSLLHQSERRRIQLAVFTDIGCAHGAVGFRFTSPETFLLPLSRLVHPFSDGSGGFPSFPFAQCLKIHFRHLDVDVNAIQQRAGNLGPVPLHLVRGAGATAILFITKKTAWTSVQLTIGEWKSNAR
jgi:hypothetical protein